MYSFIGKSEVRIMSVESTATNGSEKLSLVEERKAKVLINLKVLINDAISFLIRLLRFNVLFLNWSVLFSCGTDFLLYIYAR